MIELTEKVLEKLTWSLTYFGKFSNVDKINPEISPEIRTQLIGHQAELMEYFDDSGGLKVLLENRGLPGIGDVIGAYKGFVLSMQEADPDYELSITEKELLSEKQ